MTDVAIPSTSRPVSAEVLKGALMNASFGDWIVPDDEDHYATHVGLTGTPLNAFDQTSASDSLTVTIQSGEGYVGGAWIARDEGTDITLTAGESGQTVAVGARYQTSDSLRIDLVGNFAAEEDYHEIWSFDTDSSGVTAATNLRAVGQPSNFAQLAADETVTGAWTHENELTVIGTNLLPAIHVLGANAVDADTVVIDGDGDGGQDDDLLKVRGRADPTPEDFTDSDTVIVVKGDGRFGINTYSPNRALDVNGDVNLGETHFFSTTHFRRNESQGFVLHNRTDNPSSPSPGEMWYRSDQG